MAPPTPQPDGKTFLAAVTTVASVYVYFLIFAQFGFLQAVRTALGEDGSVVRPLMAAMGLAGIAGSILAAKVFAQATSGRWLAGGFASCALAAALSLATRSPAGFAATAVLTGLGAGITTVTLAGKLRPAVGDARLGLIVGFGTGLAYGFCNLPGIFDANAGAQAVIALGAAAVGAIAGRALIPRFLPEDHADANHTNAGIARWVVIFLALVCLDSALFYSIQHSAAIREALWGGPSQQLLNAGAHLAGALLAGWALDRGRLGSVVSIAAAAVVGAAGWFAESESGIAAVGLVYIAGVSAYSTALVFYPARRGRPGLAALLYSVAGWSGSGLGIGLVAGRGPLSMAMIATLAAVMGIGLLAGYLTSRHGRVMNEKV